MFSESQHLNLKLSCQYYRIREGVTLDLNITSACEHFFLNGGVALENLELLLCHSCGHKFLAPEHPRLIAFPAHIRSRVSIHRLSMAKFANEKELYLYLSIDLVFHVPRYIAIDFLRFERKNFGLERCLSRPLPTPVVFLY